MQEREQRGHHQALDGMRVAVAEGLTDALASASHLSFAGPGEARQRRVCGQRVALELAGHGVPVDAASGLAPAEDLAYEALHRRERRAAFAQCALL